MMASVRRKIVFPVVLASLLVAFPLDSFSQESSADSGVSVRGHRVNLYASILGSMELPDGFCGFVTADYMDAWAGYIENKASGFNLNWRAGLIVYVLESRKKDIEWQREEKQGDITIIRAALKEKDGKTLVTKIGWLEFSSLIRNSEDEKLFAQLVDSYKEEKCKTCRSFRRSIGKYKN